MWITVAGDGTASPVFIPANLGSTELGGADGRFRGGGGAQDGSVVSLGKFALALSGALALNRSLVLSTRW